MVKGEWKQELPGQGTCMWGAPKLNPKLTRHRLIPVQVTWTSNIHRSDPAYGRSYIVTNWGTVHVRLINPGVYGAHKTEVITSFTSKLFCVKNVQSTPFLENRPILRTCFSTVL